jgi:VWFA-related protein
MESRFFQCSRLLPTLLAVFLAFNSVYSQDDEIISVDSSVVLVNVTVTNRDGRFVNGLLASAFRIFEDGVERQADFFGAESTPYAAVILVDTSGSMESRVSIARGAAIKFLEGLRSKDAAAVLSFDSKVKEVRGFTSGSDLPDMFFDLQASGMTALNDAVVRASELLADRPEKRRSIVVLSDGADTISKASENKALAAATAAGATIYTVDMSTPETKPAERAAMQGTLKRFAEKTGGTFVATPGGPEMRAAFARIAEELGNQYTFTFEPKKDGKFHAIRVDVNRPNLVVRTRKGYTAKP